MCVRNMLGRRRRDSVRADRHRLRHKGQIKRRPHMACEQQTDVFVGSGDEPAEDEAAERSGCRYPPRAAHF